LAIATLPIVVTYCQKNVQNGYSTIIIKNLNRLPANYKGVNPELVYNKLIERAKTLKKDEFETTAQYNERIKVEYQKPIIDNLNIDSSFAFVTCSPLRNHFRGLTEKGYFYDADKQLLTINGDFDTKQTETGHVDDFELMTIPIKTEEESSMYDGMNNFGVKAKVTMITDNNISLIIQNWPCIFEKPLVEVIYKDVEVTKSENYFYIHRFTISPDSAKEIIKKNLLGRIFIGNILEPFTSTGYYDSRYRKPPTIKAPFVYRSEYKYIYFTVNEIWYYRIDNGLILHKEVISLIPKRITRNERLNNTLNKSKDKPTTSNTHIME